MGHGGSALSRARRQTTVVEVGRRCIKWSCPAASGQRQEGNDKPNVRTAAVPLHRLASEVHDSRNGEPTAFGRESLRRGAADPDHRALICSARPGLSFHALLAITEGQVIDVFSVKARDMMTWSVLPYRMHRA